MAGPGDFYPDMEYSDGSGGVEQEGGPGGGAGAETPALVCSTASSDGCLRSLRGGSDAACTGVLLREHELHEVVPEDHRHAVQKSVGHTVYVVGDV